MTTPTDLLFTKEHEWLRIDGNVGTIGISDHAQKELGDIVYIELPKPGTPYGSGDSFGSVESVKAVSDIYCPVSGEVTEINQALAESPEKVNDEPYGNGWLIKLKLANPAQVDQLMTAAQYTEYIGSES